ncbi:DUF930 domain-containing protein [Rhizobium sp. C4]|uniref:DUF930 domain-containing protein n=1 Tax=Rhizobium sp. C4 TaxID=1349800 RepID=UPI001E5BAD23|nr:DUF930 domain-containing protein [Rhizobium sp. C4]MCD2175946.1 DUF930 domain-containing protein [Rhizobium sp. C4]
MTTPKVTGDGKGREAQSVQARKDFRSGLAASIAIHLVALFCLLRFSPAPVEDMSEPIVSVTIVPQATAPERPSAPEPSSPADKAAEQQQPSPPSERQRDAVDAPAPTPTPAPQTAQAPDNAPTPPPQPDPAPTMKEASAFYAATILARPENRSARDALRTLSPAERNEQLCDTEAMEQIRRADTRMHPDRLIAYALQNTEVDGDRLHAPGAAFRSAHRWFRLAFDCTLDAKRSAVTAFRFAIGEPIPSSRWSDLQLER